jgi:hypothetical protein
VSRNEISRNTRSIRTRNQNPNPLLKSKPAVLEIEINEVELNKERWTQYLNNSLNQWCIISMIMDELRVELAYF